MSLPGLTGQSSNHCGPLQLNSVVTGFPAFAEMQRVSAVFRDLIFKSIVRLQPAVICLAPQHKVVALQR
jgi:hypothetical protein